MAYVNVDDAFRFEASPDLLTCPQVIEFEASDTPYVAVDFGPVLLRQNVVSIFTADTPAEVDSKTITIGDVSLSEDRKQVSMKLSGWSTGITYTISVPVTLDDGTTNVVSKRITVRVR